MKDFDTRPAALLVKGPFAATYLILLALGSGIVVALYWGIAVAQGLDPLPRSFNAQQGAARLDTLRTALTAVGGAAAVAGLYLAYRRQRSNEADSARELDKLFTDRLNALDQKIDSESSGTRLSGLTLLARLADDSGRDREACLRQLCGYLRRKVQLTDRVDLEDVNDGLRRADRSLWLDSEEWDVRRAAVGFLAQCLKASSPVRWTGFVDLRETVLIGANFEGCTFGDDVDFREAILVGASFKNCTFESNAIFRDTVLVGEISFASAIFYGDTDWNGAIINSEFDIEDANFHKGLNFDGATFNRKLMLEWNVSAMISLESAVFNSGLKINPGFQKIIKSTMREIDLVMSTTRKINLRNAKIRGAAVLPRQAIDVSGADLSQADPLELLDVSGYYFWPDFRGLVADETTEWPTTVSLGPKL